MRNKEQVEELSEIQDLIRQEKEEALQEYRSKDFRLKLQSTVRQDSHAQKTRFFRLTRLAPAALVILLMLIGGVVIVKRFVSHPAAKGQNIFEALLKGLPTTKSFRETEDITKKQETQIGSSSSLLGGEIVKVLGEVQREKASGAAVLPPPFVDKEIPHLTLKQMMEALLKEKIIHRFFNLTFDKNKEVSAWPERFSLFLA